MASLRPTDASDISDEELRDRLSRLLGPDSVVPPVTPHTKPVLMQRLKKMEETESSRNDKGKGASAGGGGECQPTAKGLQRGKMPAARESAVVGPPAKKSRASNGEEVEVATYVFFDLEATGLGGSHPRARVTELSMSAISRYEYERLQRKTADLPYNTDPSSASPRVVNKLTLCFDPGTAVPATVMGITGLDNDNLQHQGRFDARTGQLLSFFLGALAEPICLIAHNGERYDFPLFKAELAAAGVDVASFDHLLCLDSLKELRHIFGGKEEERVSEADAARKIEACGGFDFDLADFDEHWSDEGPSSHLEVYEGSQSCSESATPEKSRNGTVYRLPNTPPNSSPIKKANSETPASKPVLFPQALVSSPQLKALSSPQSVENSQSQEETPHRPIRHSGVPPPAPKSARARAAAKEKARRSRPRFEGAQRARKRLTFNNHPTSFSLPRLHEHVFGVVPATSHGAERDCEALMMVCAAKKVRAFVESPAVIKLGQVNKMW